MRWQKWLTIFNCPYRLNWKKSFFFSYYFTNEINAFQSSLFVWPLKTKNKEGVRWECEKSFRPKTNLRAQSVFWCDHKKGKLLFFGYSMSCSAFITVIFKHLLNYMHNKMFASTHSQQHWMVGWIFCLKWCFSPIFFPFICYQGHSLPSMA